MDYYDCVILSGANRLFNPHKDLIALRKYDEAFSFFRNLGPTRLRTFLESRGYSVRAVDFCDFYSRETIFSILNSLVNKKTKILGLSTVYLPQSFWDQYSDIFLQIKFKFPNLKIVLGGQSSILPLESNYIDFCIAGYAENALLAYLDYINEKTNSIKMSGVNIIDGNVDYPYESSNLLNIWKPEDYIQHYEALPTEASRGCIFKCAFCNFPMKGKKKLDYIRNFDNFKEELLRNYELYGVTNYVFADDTFNDSTQKLEQIAKLISSLPFQLKWSGYVKPELLCTFPEQIDLLIETGLLAPNFGIESFNYKTRMAVKKMGDINRVLDKLRELKEKSNNTIYNGINMIVGLPHETVDSCYQSQEYIINCDFIDGASWFPLAISDKTTTPKRKLSPIDIDPEMYGYKTRFNKLNGTMFWKNEHMNFSQAIAIANKYKLESSNKKFVHSFLVPGAQNVGFDMTDKKYIGKLKVTDVDYLEMTNNMKTIIDGYLKRILSR